MEEIAETLLLIQPGLRRDRVLAVMHNFQEEDPAKHISFDEAQKALLADLPNSMCVGVTDLRGTMVTKPRGMTAWKRHLLQRALSNLAGDKKNFYWSGEYRGGDERIAACLRNPFERNLIKPYFPPFFISPGFWLFIRLTLVWIVATILFRLQWG